MRGTKGGKGRAAGGFIPNYNAIAGYGSESSDISKGIGGAPASARPVTIPNFNFGGGQKGTMVANSSEYVVPNYAGGDGSAIFNQDMAASIGLPSRARKIGAAGGYIPNFAKKATAAPVDKSKEKLPPLNKNRDLVMFSGNEKEGRGEDTLKTFYAGKKAGKTAAYASRAEATKNKLHGLREVKVPEYKLGIKGTNKNESPLSIKIIREKLSNSSTTTALDFAKSLAPKSGVPNVSKAKIKELFNPGAFEGMSGTIFEVALSGVLSDKKFDDYATRTSTSRIDLPYEAKLFDMFETEGKGTLGAEVKANSSLAKAAAIKFYDVLFGGGVVADYKETVPIYNKDGKQTGTRNTELGARVQESTIGNRMNGIVGPDGKKVGFQALQRILGGRITVGGLRNLRTQQGLPNFAGGYIPNFANPLQDAIGREQAAGLPVNQIRVNQSPKLRNAGNPMGLAVTNTRDEPTGAIPNFASPAAPAAPAGMGGGVVMTLMAVQMAFSMLQGQLSQTEGESKKLQGAFTALNLAITGMMVTSSLGGLGNVLKSIVGGGSIGAKGGSMMEAGRGMITSGRSNLKGVRSPTGVQLARGIQARSIMGPLKVVGGALTVFGGALVSAIAPIAALIAVGWGINKLFNNLNGTTANLENNQILLASAAKNAARELSEIKIEDKEKFKEENVDITNFFKSRVEKLDFRGSKDKEQKASTVKLINEALDAGATQKAIEKIIAGMEAAAASEGGIADEYGTSSKEMVTNNVAKRVNEALEDLTFIDYSGIQDKFIAGITETQKLALAGKLTPEENEKGKQEVIDRARGTTPRPEGFVGEMPPAVENLTLAALQGALKEGGKAGGDVSKNIDKVKVDTAKTELSMQIELMKLRAKALTFDEKTLALAKRNNSLSQVGIVKLQHKIALSKEDVTINSDLADLIKDQVNKEGSQIVLDQTEITAVAKAFADADLDDLSNASKRNTLLEMTLKTLGKSEATIKASEGLMTAQVRKVVEEGTQRKVNLGYTKEQNLLDAESAERINNISKALATASFRKKTANTVKIGDSQRELDRDKQSFSINNPFIGAVGAAKAEKGFVDRQSVINIEKKDNEVVEETKGSLLGLIKVMPDLEDKIRDVIASIKDIKDIGKAFDFFDVVEGLETNDTKPTTPSLMFPKLPDGVPRLLARSEPPTVTTGAKLATDEKKAKLERLQKEREALGADEGLKQDLAGKGVGMAGAFKMYSQLLKDFTDNLRESAESLKFGLLAAKDSGGIISNIDDRLFTAAADKDRSAGGVSRASDSVALRGATDKITLARTSVERRAAIKEKDILDEVLKLKTEEVELTKDGEDATGRLIPLRAKLVELERQRLAIGTSRAELFENEFVFTQKEIQEGLDKSLVQNARTFVDTISDGLVDAISKGQDLGDTLRQAGANFFNQQASSNLKAAFQNITSSDFVKNIGSKFTGRAAGGPVTGGSGSKDDVPSLLMGGEFVMRKSAVQKYGPSFMDSLNSGKIPAMARGGLFTPGTYGQEEIKGKSNLLDFATQSFTKGDSDRFSYGSGSASVNLEPQSAALTMFGRRNSPAFQREQASKQDAFGLFTQQIQKEEAARKQKREGKKAFKNAFVGAVASAGFSALTSKFGKKSPTADITQDYSDPTQYDNGYAFTATGGAIPNAAGVDTIPSMLSGGEFVMNAAATQKIGAGNLNALNSGADGGSGDIVSKLDELISVSDNSGETIINITVNSDGSSDTQSGGDDQQTSLATRIKDVVKQVIDDEKRLGGSLRQARA